MDTSWQKQDPNKPLYEDLLWSQPQQKALAGRLLIVGGNVHAIGAPNQAYREAMQAGAGSVHVILPSAARKLLPAQVNINVGFASSTHTGSFAKHAVDELFGYIHTADYTLLAGDFSRNSETAVVFDLVARIGGMQTYVKDAVEYFDANPDALYDRPDTLVVATLAQLQKHCKTMRCTRAITYDMGILAYIQALNELTKTRQAHILTNYHGTLVVSVNGSAITTPLPEDQHIWSVRSAAIASTWWMQNPTKPLEAIATASVIMARNLQAV